MKGLWEPPEIAEAVLCYQGCTTRDCLVPETLQVNWFCVKIFVGGLRLGVYLLLYPKRDLEARFSAWCAGSSLLQIPIVCLFSSVERKGLAWGGGSICTFLLHQCVGRDVTGNGLKVSSEETTCPLCQEHHVKAANAK